MIVWGHTILHYPYYSVYWDYHSPQGFWFERWVHEKSSDWTGHVGHGCLKVFLQSSNRYETWTLWRKKSVVRSSGRWIATCTHESYSLPSVLAHVLLSCSLCILLIWSNMMTVKVPYTVDIEPQAGFLKNVCFHEKKLGGFNPPLWKIQLSSHLGLFIFIYYTQYFMAIWMESHNPAMFHSTKQLWRMGLSGHLRPVGSPSHSMSQPALYLGPSSSAPLHILWVN